MNIFYKVAELKELLKKYNLKTNGRKRELIDRIKTHKALLKMTRDCKVVLERIDIQKIANKKIVTKKTTVPGQESKKTVVESEMLTRAKSRVLQNMNNSISIEKETINFGQSLGTRAAKSCVVVVDLEQQPTKKKLKMTTGVAKFRKLNNIVSKIMTRAVKFRKLNNIDSAITTKTNKSEMMKKPEIKTISTRKNARMYFGNNNILIIQNKKKLGILLFTIFRCLTLHKKIG